MNNNSKGAINSYLTFRIGDELFASHVNHVLKILEMQQLTEVPKAPEFMKGVLNYRGNVLPVIDTRLKFGMPETLLTHHTCILVLSVELDDEEVEVGAIVDEVLNVIRYDTAAITPAPGLGSRYKSDFIEGVMKVQNQFVMLLNMNTVFSTEDIIELPDNQIADPEQDQNKENGNPTENIKPEDSI